MNALVVGGGIMGLSTAWGLVRRGHKVTLVEQHALPNPLGSSVDQHRLIRHPYAGEEGYLRLIDPAQVAWDQLWADLGACHYQQTGTLVLARGDLNWTQASIDSLHRIDMKPVLLTPAEIEQRFPVLIGDDIELAFYLPTGGVLCAERIIASLTEHLKHRGVRVATNTQVHSIDPDKAEVTLVDGTHLTADTIVVAAGPWSHRLIPPLAERITPSRQAVAYLNPPDHLSQAWKSSPMILDMHKNGGIYVVPPVLNTGLKVGDHSFSLMGDPDDDRTPEESELERLRMACLGRFRDGKAYTVTKGKICFYTVEPSEHFIAMPIEHIWVMAGFSGHGFKFGAVMGRAMAAAIDGDFSAQQMTDFAAGRIRDPAQLQAITNLCLD